MMHTVLAWACVASATQSQKGRLFALDLTGGM